GDAELLGQNAFALTHPDDAAALRQALTAQTRKFGSSQPAQFRVRHRDGGWRWAEAIATNALNEPGVAGVVVNYRDITERKQYQDELEAIARVSAALRAAHARSEMPPLILEQLLRLLRADAIALVSVDAANDEAMIELAGGQWAALTGQRLPDDPALTGLILATGRPYLNQDVRAEPRLERLASGNGLRAMAGVPLIAEQHVIGALWLGHHADIAEADVRVLAAIGDIAATALQRASLHEQTTQRLRRLAALRAIDIAIASSFDMRVTLRILLEHVRAELNADAAALLQFDTRAYALTYLLGHGFYGDAITRTRLRLGEGPAGQAAFDFRPRVVANLGGLEPPFQRPALLAEEGFVGYACAPLVTRGQVKGVLEIFQRSPLRPEAEWRDFLETLAGQAGIALDNAELLDSLQRKNLELTLAYDTTLVGWSRALDLRDRETEGHTRRVTELSVRLAQALGLGEGEITHLRRGALLHDIGKMGIPDAILHKPGPLTEAERAIMRRHPAYAYELLAPIAYLRPALDIPYCHHEKWDGTGYPRGLQGEQIPRAARIFAVADVWDALRSDRPYRPAWPEAEVRAHLQAQSGAHFDPVVVAAFLNLEL
ncbi:MAG: GAF domain-containing protein, partial [Anaerolineales bacterium]|nr:GAF domain-containing protein [Anaerolineales bacterium]